MAHIAEAHDREKEWIEYDDDDGGGEKEVKYLRFMVYVTNAKESMKRVLCSG